MVDSESEEQSQVSALPAKKIGNPRWYKGMPSPYPKGRTPFAEGGRRNIRTQLREMLDDRSPDILTKAIDKADAGDTRMLIELMKYIMPQNRAQTEMVDLEIPEDWPIEAKLDAVNNAALAGKISGDQALQITKSFQAQQEAEKLQQALTKLADLNEQIRVIDSTSRRIK